MRVVILAPGTTGDAAPAAGLGHRLHVDGGHHVTVVADAVYRPLVQATRCAFHSVPVDLTQVLTDTASGSGRPSPRVMRAYLRALSGYFDVFATHALEAAEGADVILANSVATFGHDIAEGLGIPSIDAFLQPVEPSRAYPPVLLGPAPRLTGMGNRLVGKVLRDAPAPADRACARIRRELALPVRSRRAGQRRRRRDGASVHHGISPAVMPRPADWRPELSLDGYWWPVTPPSWAPPAELADFLASGHAPIVAGFGSAAVTTRTLREVVVPAARQARMRLIIQSGQPLDITGDDVLVTGEIPHEWLFPQAAAVIHHAGAGTTAAGLRAGTPTITIPAHTDQVFWAGRVAATGAGPSPIPHPRLTPQRLTEAIQAAVTQPCYRHAAQNLRDRIGAEDGAAGLLAELGRLSYR